MSVLRAAALSGSSRVSKLRTSTWFIVLRWAALVGMGATSATIIAVGLASWTALTLVAIGVVSTAAVAWRDPWWGLLLAVAMYGCEGALKLLVNLGGSPVSSDAAVAALLDLGLLCAALGLLRHDRGKSLAELWRSSSELSRIGLALIPLWLLISAAQILQAGTLGHGLEGFRLTQAYVGLAVLGLLAYRRVPVMRIIRDLLLLLGIISGYAAVRTIVGPNSHEFALTLIRDTEALYGSTFRTVGSFESSVALASFLTPAFVFSVMVGLLIGPLRVLAWGVAALALVGLVGSYVRMALVASAIVLALGAFVVIYARWRLAGRRTWPVAIAVAAVFALLAVGAIAASRRSHALRARLSGLIHPGHDKSLQLRLQTWHHALLRFKARPLGSGLGTVGRSTGKAAGSQQVTTDNSYLKVLVEQGALGTPLFVAGLLTLLVLLTVRLLRGPPQSFSLGIPALAGWLSFLLLCITGEYLEQPGKVLAWLLLGFAVGSACLPQAEKDPPIEPAGRGAPAERSREEVPTPRIGHPTAPRRRTRPSLRPVSIALLWGSLALLLGIAPAVFTAQRNARYSTSIGVFPVKAGPFPPPARAGYVRALIHAPQVLRETLYLSKLPVPPSELADESSIAVSRKHVGPSNMPYFNLALSADTPAHATTLLTVLGRVAAGYSQDQARVAASSEEARIALELSRLQGKKRRVLAARHAALSRFVARPSARVVLGPGGARPAVSGSADRLVATLPGPFPPRPSPGWVCLAGLCLVAACWIWSRTLSGARRGGPRSSPALRRITARR